MICIRHQQLFDICYLLLLPVTNLMASHRDRQRNAAMRRAYSGGWGAQTHGLGARDTDVGKVHRGLKRLDNFISTVGKKAATDVMTQLAVAYAKAHGIIP